MKRWKKSIELREDNFVQVAKMPFVTEISKEKEDCRVYMGGLTGSLFSSVGLYVYVGNVKAGIGDWLVQDVCDHWEVMGAAEWNARKDEEI